jgi:hypothetical protein
MDSAARCHYVVHGGGPQSSSGSSRPWGNAIARVVNVVVQVLRALGLRWRPLGCGAPMSVPSRLATAVCVVIIF